MVFLDDSKERSMATSAKTAPPVVKPQTANFFELSHGKDTLTYTVSNIAGQPVLDYIHSGKTRSFVGEQIRIEKTVLGTEVTVTLKINVDSNAHLLTLVLPDVHVGSKGPEKLSVPVIFHTLLGTIVGPPPIGPAQTYEVQIFHGTASFVVS
jgi:hypothetical protein